MNAEETPPWWRTVRYWTVGSKIKTQNGFTVMQGRAMYFSSFIFKPAGCFIMFLLIWFLVCAGAMDSSRYSFWQCEAQRVDFLSFPTLKMGSCWHLQNKPYDKFLCSLSISCEAANTNYFGDSGMLIYSSVWLYLTGTFWNIFFSIIFSLSHTPIIEKLVSPSQLPSPFLRSYKSRRE